MSESPKISIVVPVYNSETILPILVSKIEETMVNMDLSYEIILFDDFSTDNSWEIIQELMSKHSFTFGFSNVENEGQPKTTMNGIKQSKGEFICTIDDDLEYNPKDIEKLYMRLTSNEYDVVFGLAKDKYEKQGKSKMIANIRNHILNFFWNKSVTDSFKIFKREVLFDGDFFMPEIHFEAYISKTLKKEKIGYVNVSFAKRLTGSSNYNLFKKFKLFLAMNKDYKKNEK